MTPTAVSWDEYVRARFPAYLLPKSAAVSLSVDEAHRFLEGITGRPHELELLRATSLLAPRIATLRAFALESLADLVRNLPSRSHRMRREWEGGFHGRLAVSDTLALHMAGRTTSFVTHSRRRAFDLPENVFLRGVCERLLSVLMGLRLADALPDEGWASGARDCEGALRRVLASTALREVPSAPLSYADEAGARSARHDAYRQAVAWAGWLREALDDDEPARIARVVAEGALLPLSAPTRFELAVAMRLSEALGEALDARQPGRWNTERALIVAGRREILAFVRDDDLTVRVFYNQAVLPSGMADLGGAHYLENAGRLRPDVTVTVARGKARLGAVVLECKLSDRPEYILSGYHEAVLYRWEYSDHLLPWPKAILVASGAVPGAVRATDDVVASAWAEWPPRSVIDVLAAHIAAA